MMRQEKIEGLTKIEAGDRFNKLFEDEANSNCFQCAKKSKQWAQPNHGIFLCLTCAANYKQTSKAVNVKSIGLDVWKQEQVRQLQLGGNKKFKQYLEIYNLAGTEPKLFLRSKAAQYYRRYLLAEVKGEKIEDRPSIQEGRQLFVSQIPLSEMTTDQILTEAKQKLNWAGERTSYYGKRAYEKVHHKITSGELKQDAKDAAQTVSKTAKSIWAMVTTKIQQMQKPKPPGQGAQL